MTFPLSLPEEPGESEFSHGKGLMASARQRSQMSDPLNLIKTGMNDPEGPWQPSVYEQDKAVQRTDPANPTSTADYAAPPFSNDNITGNQWERES